MLVNLSTFNRTFRPSEPVGPGLNLPSNTNYISSFRHKLDLGDLYV